MEPVWAQWLRDQYNDLLLETLEEYSNDPEKYVKYVKSGGYDPELEQFCDIISEAIFFWCVDNLQGIVNKCSIMDGKYRGVRHKWVEVCDSNRNAYVIDGAHAQFGNGPRLNITKAGPEYKGSPLPDYDIADYW